MFSQIIKYTFLAALRVLRKVIQQKDEQYNRYIIEKKVIDPVVECFMSNGHRYNLLNSAILEFFDFIRHVSFFLLQISEIFKDSIYSLMTYVIKNHYDNTLKDIAYTQMFVQMKARHQARENSSLHGTEEFSLFNEESRRIQFNSQWAKERDYDDDELFFSREDEEDDESEQSFNESEAEQKLVPQRKIAMEPIYPSVAKRKSKKNYISFINLI